jgi:tRNA(fMet)-specific endonuclease VapC
MKFLLDTYALIALLKNPRDGMMSWRVRQQRHEDVATSAIALHELISGALRGAPERRRANLDLVRGLRLRTLPFDDADAEAAGRIDAALKLVGTPIGPLDIFIAGQALARGLTVVTNNTREFARVPGLSVVDWSQ